MIIDSSFFIALLNNKDQFHKRAVGLQKEISKTKNDTVPLLMLSETIASISSRYDCKIAKTT